MASGPRGQYTSSYRVPLNSISHITIKYVRLFYSTRIRYSHVLVESRKKSSIIQISLEQEIKQMMMVPAIEYLLCTRHFVKEHTVSGFLGLLLLLPLASPSPSMYEYRMYVQLNQTLTHINAHTNARIQGEREMDREIN